MEYKRSCDGCTKCCDGWLEGFVYDKRFFPGNKCHFVTCNGCAIYEKRPDNPCKNYRCQWLDNLDLPEWLKPDVANVIITAREMKGIKYWEMIETGENVEGAVLNNVMTYCLRNRINLKYQVHQGGHWFGSDQFVAMMNESDNNKKAFM